MIHLDIINGQSAAKHGKYGTFFVKHLDNRGSCDIDYIRKEHLAKAKAQKLPTTEEREQQLIEDESWTDKESRRVDELKVYAKNLRVTMGKLVLKKQIDTMSEDINKAEKEILELVMKRDELIGMTADKYANKKVNEHYIYRTSFKDKELKTPLFTEEEYDELSDQEIGSLVFAYNEKMDHFCDINLKRIAVSGFFLNVYYLCKDDPFIFYGKPLVELTFHQVDLFSFGRYFKHVMAELKHPPTDEQLDDPDKLIEMFNVSKNAEKVLSEGKATSGKDKVVSTVVGATKEDMERMNVQNESGAVDINKIAEEKGGHLSMEDLIKLHKM